MSEMNSLPQRDQVPEELTWDLSPIYANDAEFEKDLADYQKQVGDLSNLKGSLSQGPSELKHAIESILEGGRHLERIYLYAHLKNDQDTAEAKYQAYNDQARSLASDYSTAVSWFEPELMALDDQILDQYMDQEDGLHVFQHYIEMIRSKKDHTLDSDTEALLASASQIFSASSQTFSVLNNADLEFPTIQTEEGKTLSLSHGSYSQFLESPDRSLREEAFKKYYSSYESHENTFASTLQGNIRVHNFSAQTRNYTSARQAALSKNFIPESVYDHLVERVNHYLPTFHDYLSIRKARLGLDKLHMYDMYVALADDTSFKYSYEEAKEITLKALAPLGDDYQQILKKAFDERWIDVVENKGKRSGAYSSGNYDSNPYILLNWHDSLNNLYTLVHELGHSVHSYLTHQHQPYVYGDYSIFLAEIASTTNENLLTHYLLEQAGSDQEKIVIINQFLDSFKGTVYRQTQFAEFEHYMHEALAGGHPLTANFLNESYYELNQKYYGSGVVSDDQIAYEWSRIPHFYYNYYVYQYATGFSAATSLAQNILSGQEGLDHYLSFLKAGESDYPIEVMKRAGVDMTQTDYLDQAFQVFINYLDDLKELVNGNE